MSSTLSQRNTDTSDVMAVCPTDKRNQWQSCLFVLFCAFKCYSLSICFATISVQNVSVFWKENQLRSSNYIRVLFMFIYYFISNIYINKCRWQGLKKYPLPHWIREEIILNNLASWCVYNDQRRRLLVYHKSNYFPKIGVWENLKLLRTNPY